MREKHGEYIYLYWDSEPEVEYIKGHVTAEEAQLEYVKQTGSKQLLVGIQHKFARWTFADEFTCEGCEFQLKVYDKPSRGAFKVTECQLPLHQEPII